MTVFLIRRLLQTVAVLAAMSLIVFLGVNVIGNPVDILINPDASPAEIAATIERLGLDRPLPEQYLRFLLGALQGDLGRSFVYGVPALQLILQRAPATFELALAAMLMAVVIGLPLGLYAGLHAERPAARSVMAASILGFSLPNFWQGLVLILIFAVLLGWLPSTGRGPTSPLLGVQVSFLSLAGLRHLVLPATNLALYKVSLVIRLTQACTREVLLQDYIKYAHAKGLRRRRIVLVHLLKNIMIPVVTVLGLELGGVIAFAVVTETVFAWPGMGKLIIDSIQVLDRPMIVAYLLITALIFVTINLIVDLVYSALDPRVRLQDSGR